MIARAKGSWTWTSRISTVSAVVDSIVTTYEEVALSGRPHISATVFSGLQQKGESGQPPADHWPSTPGKAEREVPISPWLRLLVQFPVGAEIQFVPPILMVTLNASRMVLAPGLLAQCRAGLRPSSRTAADQQLSNWRLHWACYAGDCHAHPYCRPAGLLLAVPKGTPRHGGAKGSQRELQRQQQQLQQQGHPQQQH